MKPGTPHLITIRYTSGHIETLNSFNATVELLDNGWLRVSHHYGSTEPADNTHIYPPHVVAGYTRQPQTPETKG